MDYQRLHFRRQELPFWLNTFQVASCKINLSQVAIFLGVYPQRVFLATQFVLCEHNFMKLFLCRLYCKLSHFQHHQNKIVLCWTTENCYQKRFFLSLCVLLFVDYIYINAEETAIKQKKHVLSPGLKIRLKKMALRNLGARFRSLAPQIETLGWARSASSAPSVYDKM